MYSRICAPQVMDPIKVNCNAGPDHHYLHGREKITTGIL